MASVRRRGAVERSRRPQRPAEAPLQLPTPALRTETGFVARGATRSSKPRIIVSSCPCRFPRGTVPADAAVPGAWHSAPGGAEREGKESAPPEARTGWYACPVGSTCSSRSALHFGYGPDASARRSAHIKSQRPNHINTQAAHFPSAPPPCDADIPRKRPPTRRFVAIESLLWQ